MWGKDEKIRPLEKGDSRAGFLHDMARITFQKNPLAEVIRSGSCLFDPRNNPLKDYETIG
jgi:hypothetical protein